MTAIFPIKPSLSSHPFSLVLLTRLYTNADWQYIITGEPSTHFYLLNKIFGNQI